MLLIEPEAARAYEERQKAAVPPPLLGTAAVVGGQTEPTKPVNGTGSVATTEKPVPAGVRSKAFHSTIDIAAATAKMRMVEIADEIVSVLLSDPNATVKVVLEISAEYPDGVKDSVKRAVSENVRSLGLKNADWE